MLKIIKGKLWNTEWSDMRWACLKCHVLLGIQITQSSALLKCSVSSWSHNRKKLGFEPKFVTYGDKWDAVVAMLYRIGVGIKRIGSEIDTSSNYVRDRVELLKLEKPSEFARVNSSKLPHAKNRRLYRPPTLRKIPEPVELLQQQYNRDLKRFAIGDENHHWNNHPVKLSYIRSKPRNTGKQSPFFCDNEKYRSSDKIKRYLRQRLWKWFRTGKTDRWCIDRMVGLTSLGFRSRLESLFEQGMSHDNYGKVWEIDHIVPCCFFDLTDINQARKCFHWSNLRPMFVRDNRRRGGMLNSKRRARPARLELPAYICVQNCNV